MKRFTTMIATVALAGTASFAVAQDKVQPQLKMKPVAMSDAQLDQVAGGLVFINVSDIDISALNQAEFLNDNVVNILNNNRTQIPLNVAIGLLGNAAILQNLPTVIR